MQIGQLAKQAGVNIQTVRFYERRSLLPRPERKESGYRIYGDQDLRRLRFIRQAKALGFSLDEIRQILSMRDRGACPCGQVSSLAEQHLGDIRQRIRQLAEFERELNRAVKQWRNSGQPQLAGDEFCALIEHTMGNQGKTRKQR